MFDIFQAIQSMINSSSLPWVIPQFNDQKEFTVEALWNPLLILSKDSDSIITNCMSLSSDESLLISGPNMGGKTTVLRSVGMIYYLAMLGCAVPAATCSIHLVDCIAVRLGAEDDVSLGLSTFMNELVELEQCVRTSTASSVVIVDEFGRGTSTCEGMGLLLAVLEDMAMRGVRAFCATHFHEIVQYSTQLNYKSMYMAVLEDKDQILLTYKLVIGESEKS